MLSVSRNAHPPNTLSLLRALFSEKNFFFSKKGGKQNFFLSETLNVTIFFFSFFVFGEKRHKNVSDCY